MSRKDGAEMKKNEVSGDGDGAEGAVAVADGIVDAISEPLRAARRCSRLARSKNQSTTQSSKIESG